MVCIFLKSPYFGIDNRLQRGNRLRGQTKEKASADIKDRDNIFDDWGQWVDSTGKPMIMG